MARRQFSLKATGLLLVLVLSSPVVNMVGGSELLVSGLAQWEYEPGVEIRDETAVALDSLAPDSQNYLQTEFCQGGLCPAGGWQQWIIVDEASDWTVAQLTAVHRALLDTFGALAQAGINGRHLLAGYRFRHQPGEFVNGRQESIALARHEYQEIILTDSAFTVQAGFSIYHELGHAVDNRLHRQLTAGFVELIGGGEDYRRETGFLIPDGYWVRTQTRHSPYEATADAFGVWVTVGYLQAADPVFRTTPPDVNHRAISSVVQTAVQLAAADQETTAIITGK